MVMEILVVLRDPAAYRYTEAKMSKISVEMLTDINKETIPFTTNYDDRLKEPVVLPSRFPNLLVNGSTGIVGYKYSST